MFPVDSTNKLQPLTQEELKDIVNQSSCISKENYYKENISKEDIYLRNISKKIVL